MSNGECYCPNCGSDGQMDGQGHFGREFTRHHGSGEKKLIRQVWFQMQCTGCRQKFRVMEDEVEVGDD